MHTKFLPVKLEKLHSEDRERIGRMTLSWILGRQIVRMGGGWNWLRIVSSGRLWY